MGLCKSQCNCFVDWQLHSATGQISTETKATIPAVLEILSSFLLTSIDANGDNKRSDDLFVCQNCPNVSQLSLMSDRLIDRSESVLSNSACKL